MSEAIIHAEAHGHEAGHHELSFFRTYIFSTDHKMIGKQFLGMGLGMMALGGIPRFSSAGAAWPRPRCQHALGARAADVRRDPPETYNAFFTMHATIMIFFAVMPIPVGCWKLLIPLMIGARDMPPALNALRSDRHPCGHPMLASFPSRGAAAAGWTSYPPSARCQPTPASTGDRTSGASA
jgi:cytochrome c oxidase subunit 1